MYYASICAIVKDEEKDILEWLTYHFATGFEHVFLYDNNSAIPLKNFLQEFIAAGLVTVIDFPGRHDQLEAYGDALQRFGARTNWLAFIDIDEFILPLAHTDVRDLLDDYTHNGGLAMHWTNFGSGGHLSRPSGGILKNYTSSLGIQGHVKSIVRPKVTLRPISPHHFSYSPGFVCVNEDGIPVTNFSSYPVGKKIRINHYYYKSQQDFHKKIERGVVTKRRKDFQRKIEVFYDHLQDDSFIDTQIFRFIPIVNKFLDLPVPVFASIIKNKNNIDYEKELININNLVENNKIADAIKLLARLRRYFDEFDLRILEAKMNILLKDLDSALKIIIGEMSRADRSREEMYKCYQLCALYYDVLGDRQKAGLIREYISA